MSKFEWQEGDIVITKKAKKGVPKKESESKPLKKKGISDIIRAIRRPK